MLVIDENLEDTSWMLSPLKKIQKKKFACEWGAKLVKLLVKKDTSWEKTESRSAKHRVKFHQYGKSSSTAQQDEITAHEYATQQYPQAIEHIDQNGRNILHVAILYRNHEVYDFVVDRKYAKERLRGKIDNDANTLLHMVGEEIEDVDTDLKGPALVLQENMQMFKV
ncbi:hypothetical protein L1987_12708 [Smallanthus sonchifolius]|uniref:Uncharacterized protein n=1 Tax=Smallanthus sonchifolius TaxID=185202 RepID=A0ACB9JEW1_9ASTR|nr:hypothetical protein L1987_12708 [Smallanthus sonchifolius]